MKSENRPLVKSLPSARHVGVQRPRTPPLEFHVDMALKCLFGVMSIASGLDCAIYAGCHLEKIQLMHEVVSFTGISCIAAAAIALWGRRFQTTHMQDLRQETYEFHSAEEKKFKRDREKYLYFYVMLFGLCYCIFANVAVDVIADLMPVDNY